MTRGAPYRDGPRVAVALLLASSPAVVVLATGGESFRLADPFLRAVHTDHIREFQGLARHLAGASWLQVLQSVSALPLVLLPAGALLWRSPGAGAGGRALRALGAGMAVVGIAFVLVSSQAGVTTLLDAAGLRSSGSPLVRLAPFGAGAAAALLAFVLLFLGWWRDTPSPAPEDALRIATVGGAGTALSALALLQVRWLPTAAAALLALLLALVALGSPAGAARRGTRATRVAFLLLVIVPFPLLTTVLLWRSSEYATGMEAPQVVARDVAYRLRAGASGRDVVVAAPPVTTTWLVYFGGFRGLGTLYWENLEGLRVTAALGSVRGEVEARELLARHGVTHLIVPSWERFPVPTCSRDPRDACRLGSGARRAEEPTFLERALNSEALPDWLVPISYEPPAVPALTGVRVRIFEVRANPGTGS